MRPLRVFVAVLMLAAVILPSGTLFAAEVTGRPRVLSGDLLRVGDQTVRLYGIDAPEQDQYCENDYGRPFECGIEALDALSELIGRRMVTCVGDRSNDAGQLLAVCYAGDTNLNGRMVRTGWAVARPDEQPDFTPMERLARGERVGIWALKFMDPAEWRKQNP